MPTYEYQCDACNHNFDEFQSMMDKPLRKCPKCKKPKLRRLFGTGAAIIFKGSGFYETDYRSDSYTAAAKAETDSAAPKSEAATASQSATASPAGTTEPSTPTTKAGKEKSTGKTPKSKK